MKNIHLKCDEEFFYKMKQDKQMREADAGSRITWEEYIRMLFGLVNEDDVNIA